MEESLTNKVSTVNLDFEPEKVDIQGFGTPVGTNIMSLFKDNLKRADFDVVIKAFYNEAVKKAETLQGDELKGFQTACTVFDDVINAYKKLHE